MCAAKRDPSSDDEDATFKRQYDNMIDKTKRSRASKRTKITKAHVAKHEELQRRIQSLKRHASTTNLTAGDGARSLNEQTGLDALRGLLNRKADIEQRIIACIQSLETAMNTTSREIQLTLQNRVNSTSDNHVPKH